MILDTLHRPEGTTWRYRTIHRDWALVRDKDQSILARIWVDGDGWFRWQLNFPIPTVPTIDRSGMELVLVQAAIAVGQRIDATLLATGQAPAAGRDA